MHTRPRLCLHNTRRTSSEVLTVSFTVTIRTVVCARYAKTKTKKIKNSKEHGSEKNTGIRTGLYFGRVTEKVLFVRSVINYCVGRRVVYE